jgi:hypothetical protein
MFRQPIFKQVQEPTVYYYPQPNESYQETMHAPDNRDETNSTYGPESNRPGGQPTDAKTKKSGDGRFDLDSFLKDNDFISQTGTIKAVKPRRKDKTDKFLKIATDSVTESDEKPLAKTAKESVMASDEEPITIYDEKNASDIVIGSKKSAKVRQGLSGQKHTTETQQITGSDGYRSATIHDNDYHIRGGGYTQSKSIAIRVVLGLITLAALIVCVFSLAKLIGTFNTSQSSKAVVTVSDDNTHQAMAEYMPELLSFMGTSADDVFSSLSEKGIAVSLNDRKTSDNTDGTAVGKEIVHLSNTQDTTELEAYSSSEFNGFTMAELQGNLLGAWMLDDSIGDKGSYLQLKYVNLAATDLDGEMEWLLKQQNLLGGNGVELARGKDNKGNNFILGYTTLNDKTYYWRAANCSFNAIYQGTDTSSYNLPGTSSYVRLRVANWDFYGVADYQKSADNITGGDAGTADTSASG